MLRGTAGSRICILIAGVQQLVGGVPARTTGRMCECPGGDSGRAGARGVRPFLRLSWVENPGPRCKRPCDGSIQALGRLPPASPRPDVEGRSNPPATRSRGGAHR